MHFCDNFLLPFLLFSLLGPNNIKMNVLKDCLRPQQERKRKEEKVRALTRVTRYNFLIFSIIFNNMLLFYGSKLCVIYFFLLISGSMNKEHIMIKY